MAYPKHNKKLMHLIRAYIWALPSHAMMLSPLSYHTTPPSIALTTAYARSFVRALHCLSLTLFDLCSLL